MGKGSLRSHRSRTAAKARSERVVRIDKPDRKINSKRARQKGARLTRQEW